MKKTVGSVKAVVLKDHPDELLAWCVENSVRNNRTELAEAILDNLKRRCGR